MKIFFRGLLRLLRPYWWGKTIFFIILGSAMAVNGVPDLKQLFLGLLILVPLLYGGLYTLNDLSDIKVDSLHHEKKQKSITSNMVSKKQAFIFAPLLIATALIAGYYTNRLFFYCMLIMFLNQVVYSFEPTRLKTKAFFDVFSAVFISSGFKFLAGWFLFTDSFNIPLLPLLGIIIAQSGGYLLYKLKYNKPIDIQLKQKTTVTTLPESFIKPFSNLLILMGFLFFLFLPINSIIFPSLNYLGTLPFRFLFLFLAYIIFFPFYIQKFKTTKGVFKLQTQIYSAYFVFAILFLLLYSI